MICTPKSVKIFSCPNALENIAPLLVCITLQYVQHVCATVLSAISYKSMKGFPQIGHDCCACKSSANVQKTDKVDRKSAKTFPHPPQYFAYLRNYYLNPAGFETVSKRKDVLVS